MPVEDPNTPANSKEPVANTDWAELLSSEDITNLTGFFDVLIEMDFEQKQRNKQRIKNETNKRS
jgi:hypothetical protein